MFSEQGDRGKIAAWINPFLSLDNLLMFFLTVFLYFSSNKTQKGM